MKNDSLKVIGKNASKVDGVELVTGKARFVSDMRFPGMLYGCTRRARISAAKLKSVNVKPAYSVEGVEKVFLASDIPGPNIMGILPPFDQPLLAFDEIRYEGESVALVIADSAGAAKKGADSIEISLEALEPILTVEDALKDGARKIHPNGNITFSKKLTKGDVDTAFADADVVVENTYETSFQEHGYLEPEAVCAVPSGDNRVTVYASCQSPFHLRGHIASNLGLPAGRVKVVQAYTGGSFGGKDDVAVEIGSLAGTAAIKTGRPVMIVHDREESIIGSNLRHAAKITYRTAATKDGVLLARQAEIFLDGGAYASESPFVTMKALIHAAGPYIIPNVLIESTSVYTNKTYAGAFRGFGVPQVTFAAESQIDELAEKLGMDRLELRMKNALGPGDPTATGQVYRQSVGLRETIEIIKKKHDALSADKAAGVNGEIPSDSGRYVSGTGFSSMLQGISNGAEGIDVVGASVQMGQDASVLIGVGLCDMGQGSRTVFAQIAAEVLGIDLAAVTVRQVDTDSVHDSGPTVASRSTTVGGMAVMKAAEEVKKSLISMAALMFKVEEALVLLDSGFAVLSVDENAKIPIRDVATAAYWTGFPLMNLTFSRAPEAKFDEETHQGDIYIAYNFGTHMMKVTVDTWTGEVTVTSHAASHDTGKVINPRGFEGQVEGASLMGFGLAHMEKIIHNPQGKILNSNFADYAIPSIMDRIPTETFPVEDYNPTGPYGAKGIGEPPVAAAAAAFANAVSNALGHRFTKLPITREEIHKVINERGT
jgi:nicotinate dehydrogenase large molybdopterin subunit